MMFPEQSKHDTHEPPVVGKQCVSDDHGKVIADDTGINNVWIEH